MADGLLIWGDANRHRDIQCFSLGEGIIDSDFVTELDRSIGVLDLRAGADRL